MSNRKGLNTGDYRLREKRSRKPSLTMTASSTEAEVSQEVIWKLLQTQPLYHLLLLLLEATSPSKLTKGLS
jgi:hypothetical protein